MSATLLRELLQGWRVLDTQSVPGGSIAYAYRVETSDGPIFAKTMPVVPPGMFEREAAGLQALRATGTVRVPEVLHVAATGLVLEWIEAGYRSGGEDPDFGSRLAALHQVHGVRFGSIDADQASYVGSVPVDLAPAESWATDYLDGRVRQLIDRCVRLGRLDPAARGLLDQLVERADEVCGPPEPPSLLHGDLWSGNRMIDTRGRDWVIDPAANYGHRELDLAMMRLFGGFRQTTYTAYQEVAPLADGWEQRIPLHQLLPLLVHVELFGGSFAEDTMRALRRMLP